jgi:nitroreductase
MQRRHFIGLSTGAVIVAATAAAYALSDRRNLLRADLPLANGSPAVLQPDEREILFLASLAPSGHNTQPWFVIPLDSYHWVIGNDRRKWLPAVDPEQRETLLSLGAFQQNLEFAAEAFGYICDWTLLATSNQAERVLDVRLTKVGPRTQLKVEAMKSRRTMRSGFLSTPLRNADLAHLVGAEPEFMHYLSTGSSEARAVNEQTIQANRLQSERDPAQQELADWIRFSSDDARKYCDGLSTAGMELSGAAGWVVRNFYDKHSVMKAAFRERGIEQVQREVAASGGWILITSHDASVASLLETGRRMQRLFLKVRARSVGLHPMTQILEEPSTKHAIAGATGQGGHVQFILRVGYVSHYPPPVSLRRPVAWFLRREEAHA